MVFLCRGCLAAGFLGIRVAPPGGAVQVGMAARKVDLPNMDPDSLLHVPVDTGTGVHHQRAADRLVCHPIHTTQLYVCKQRALIFGEALCVVARHRCTAEHKMHLG